MPNTNSTINYKPFNEFVFRIPIFNAEDASSYKGILSDTIFKEAIYFASRPLYHKIISTDARDPYGLPDKVKRSVFKYFVRMTTRCTPFGLFAGCGIGKIGETSAITFNREDGLKTRTRVNLLFLALTAKIINETAGIRSDILFYPNTTLFKVHNFYRYIEPKFVDTCFEYLLSEIIASAYLEKVLSACTHGASKKDLITLLVREEDIDDEDARDYIEQLVDSQIIVSEFSIHITRVNNIEYFLERISALEGGQKLDIFLFLDEIKNRLKAIDNTAIGSRTSMFEELEGMIKQRIGSPKDSILLQSNLFIEPQQATIGEDIVSMAKQGLRVLNILTPPVGDPLMDDFKRKFYDRYELEEVPLVEALDPDIGVSRGNFSAAYFGASSLASGITRESGTMAAQTANGSSNVIINSIIHKKYCDYLRTNAEEINIFAADLNGLTENWDDLPVTLSVGIEILKRRNNQKPMILFKYAGGYSAINTLARFSDNNDHFKNCAESITKFEDEYYPEDTVVADIVYLAEDLGLANIMQRPALRKYEIPILSLPSSDNITKIDISDILISINEDLKLTLRSRTLNKFIIPRNTTAHNFTFKTSPLYHFLCSFQGEGNIRGAILFDWGSLMPKDGYFPRVVYEHNIILSAAKWMIKATEINEKDDFIHQIKSIILSRKIPDKVYITSAVDAKLQLDLTCDDTFDVLKTEIKGGYILLEECLVDKRDALVTSGGKYYNHEIVLNFYKATEE